MRKIIFLLFFTTSIFGQNSELISDIELCEQIKSAIKYLKADKELKTRSFRFHSAIENGWNYNIFLSEYVSYKLGVEKEKIFDLDTTKTYPIFRKLKSIKPNTSELKLNCIRKRRKPNVRLSKLDFSNLLFNVTTNRVGKEGASGKTYLFFFEDKKVMKVYKSDWIE